MKRAFITDKPVKNGPLNANPNLANIYAGEVIAIFPAGRVIPHSSYPDIADRDTCTYTQTTRPSDSEPENEQQKTENACPCGFQRSRGLFSSMADKKKSQGSGQERARTVRYVESQKRRPRPGWDRQKRGGWRTVAQLYTHNCAWATVFLRVTWMRTQTVRGRL